MWSFRDNRLLEPVDVTVANLIGALGRYQGRQELYRYQTPQILETLRQVAVVESTEASNRIEGIVVSPHRLRALMVQATPETRFESEIAGYRDVKETYYEALLRSSRRWDTGHHDLTPWYQYSLGVLVRAYREFEARVGELVATPGAKREAVLTAIETFGPGQTFSISELERLCPIASRATIRRVLGELRQQEQVECLGTGRSALWRKL